MKLVFATGNRGKLQEAAEILGEGFELVTPADMGLEEDIPETGKTLAANSLLKAKYISDHLGADCFADDTGLEVEILGGAPGLHTARYAGDAKDPKANIAKLLTEMARKEREASLARAYGLRTVHATRCARFVTVATLILDGEIHTFTGEMTGKIGIVPTGKGGFGYDPVFIPDWIPAEEPGAPQETPDADGLVPNRGRLTCAQISEEAKNRISHRGKALRAMAEFLHSL